MDKGSDSGLDGEEMLHDNFDQDLYKLVQYARGEGYVVRNGSIGGNCMFHAVADQMKMLVLNWKGNHSMLRKQVVQYLYKKDKDQITGEHLKDFIYITNWNDYLEDLSHDGTYGDHLTLFTLSNLLKKKIIVITSEGRKITIHASSMACGKPIVLGHIPARHYVSLWSPESCPETLHKGQRYLKDSSSDESHENSDDSHTMMLVPPHNFIKNVGSRQLTGDLQKRTVLVTFNEMFKHLSQIKYQQGIPALMQNLNNMFNHLKISSGDIETVSVAYGCLVSFYLGGNLDQCLNILKLVNKSLPEYTTKESSIVSTVVNYRLYQFYTYKAKYGKAWNFLQRALMNIQEDAPSSWTAQVYFFRAQMYDRYSQLTPKSRLQSQEQAIRNLILARESFLSETSSKDVNYQFQPMLCTLYIACITLDMPTIETINTFNKTHLTIQCGSSSTIKQEDVNKADQILRSIRLEQIQTLENMYQLDIDEKILIVSMFVAHRQFRLYIHHSIYNEAFDTLKQMREAYMKWELKYKDYDRAVYNISPILTEDITSLYKKNEQELVSRCPVLTLKLHSLNRILVKIPTKHDTSDSATDATIECDDFSDQFGNSSGYGSSD